MVVVLDGFIDESGTHRGSPNCTVAACVGTRGQWKTFLNEWGTSTEFHAKDSKYDPLWPKLYDIFRRSKLQGIVGSINPQDYLDGASNQWRSAIGNTYAICAFACVLGLIKVFPDHRCSWVIEDGQPNCEWVERALKSLMPTYPQIASVVRAQKSEFVELQTSDFVSHVWSTNHPVWKRHVKETGLLEARLGKQHFAELSVELAQSVRKMRKARRERQKRQRETP